MQGSEEKEYLSLPFDNINQKDSSHTVEVSLIELQRIWWIL